MYTLIHALSQPRIVQSGLTGGQAVKAALALIGKSFWISQDKETQQWTLWCNGYPVASAEGIVKVTAATEHEAWENAALVFPWGQSGPKCSPSISYGIMRDEEWERRRRWAGRTLAVTGEELEELLGWYEHAKASSVPSESFTSAFLDHIGDGASVRDAALAACADFDV